MTSTPTTVRHPVSEQPANSAAPTAPGLLWVLFGLALSVGGAYLAGVWTSAHLDGTTDDFEGMLYLVTVPAGWLAGFAAALASAFSIDRHDPRDGSSRLFLVSIVPMIPIVLIFVLIALA